MADLPWHAGDHAVTADGERLIVAEVRDGLPLVWWWAGGQSLEDRRDGYHWPADAVPDLADVGTAARWLRSCAEVTGIAPLHALCTRQRNAARDAIHAAASMLVWIPDPTLTARAVEATRACLALETR